MKYEKKLHTAGLALGVLSTFGLLAPNLNASDHQEAPGATALLSADIGDYYAWHEGENLNMVLTFGTFRSIATFCMDFILIPLCLLTACLIWNSSRGLLLMKLVT